MSGTFEEKKHTPKMIVHFMSSIAELEVEYAVIFSTLSCQFYSILYMFKSERPHKLVAYNGMIKKVAKDSKRLKTP